MTSDNKERGFVASTRRFFWWPREEAREAAPVPPLARVWALAAAIGAGLVAIGWEDQVQLIVLATVFAMLDDVIEGVRNRWPALILGLAAGWGADKLLRAMVSAPADPDWADYPPLVTGTLVAFVTFAAITRLPSRRRRRLQRVQ
jgi:hypothetical protein